MIRYAEVLMFLSEDGKTCFGHLKWSDPDLLIFVMPEHRRKGYATELYREAIKRWPGIDLSKQMYTEDGLRWKASL